MRPDDLARRLTDRRVRDRQDHVRELERRARNAGQRPDRAHDASRFSLGRGSVPAAGDPFADGSARELVAQLLDLLQDALELVLGSMQLLVQPRHVGPSGEAQIPQHEIAEIRADPCDRCDVLGAACQQQAEARLGDELLERLRGARLGLLVQRLHLLVRRWGACDRPSRLFLLGLGSRDLLLELGHHRRVAERRDVAERRGPRRCLAAAGA